MGAADGGCLWRSDGTTAGTIFVKRFDPDPMVFARPRRLTKVGSLIYFIVDFGANGQELWRSDGTGPGTFPLKPPGLAGSFDYAAELVDLGGTLVFACGASPGCGLWKSDGTEAGTVPVADVSAPMNLTVSSGTLFFVAGDAAHGRELWKSNGSAAGTVLVRDIVAGPSDSWPSNLTPLGGTLLFTLGTDGTLWRSDGTEAGTVQLSALTPAAPLVGANGLVYFAVGSSLWRTDGTPGGMASLRDFVSPVDLYQGMRQPDGFLFWADDGSHGTELWRTDGSPGGTTLVVDLTPGPGGSPVAPTPGSPVTVQGMSFFVLAQGPGVGLYRTDGTANGTFRVINPSFPPNDGLPAWLADANGTLFFSANDGVHGRELWRSDGTAAGTFLVKDINPGPGDSQPGRPVATSKDLFFRACEPATGCELWRSDGTEAGTRLVRDIQPGPSDGYGYDLLTLGDILFFLADDGTRGPGVWRSDGTEAGTFLLTPAAIDPSGRGPMGLGLLNGHAYFTAWDGSSTTLWKSDGTLPGTSAVGSVPGATEAGAVLRDLLIFPTSDAAAGTALWKTDGTAAGTTQLKPINPNAEQILFSLRALGDRIVFGADDGLHGSEPWVTDGTPSGTHLLKDINPGSPRSMGSSITVLGSTAFFFADDGVHGYEPWKTDGTEAGTSLVLDVAPGPAGSMFLERMAAGGHHVYFTASDHVHGRQIWQTDGSAGGTVRVTDFVPGGRGGLVPYLYSYISYGLVRSLSSIFFVASDGATGYELWSLPFGTRFFTLDPCRILDTRKPDGPSGGPALGTSDVRAFPAAGQCGIPSTAAQVAANVTVVNPSGGGELSLFAGGPVPPSVSTFSFSGGRTRANNAVLSLGSGGTFSIRSSMPGGGSVHVVVDVTGYFE